MTTGQKVWRIDWWERKLESKKSVNEMIVARTKIMLIWE